MIEGVDFTVSYAPAAGTRSLCIIIAIYYAEGIFFSWTYPSPSKIIFYPILKKGVVSVYHIYIPVMVQNQMAKTSIRFNKLKRTLRSSHQTNTGVKT